jgi:hypothetical protein
VLRDGEPAFRTLALNDVVVNKGEIGRMIELEVKVDGELIHVLRADGLIVSTPTGSTAYALSANGPILHPSVPGIAIVPLCPHALSNRPITVSDSSTIDIALLPPHDARVHFDGQKRFDARAGDVVRMRARAMASPCCIRPATAISPCCGRSCTGVRPPSHCPAMLLRLIVRDFVIVDRIELEFGGGFGALTGETGAGKSILVDACRWRWASAPMRRWCAAAPSVPRFPPNSTWRRQGRSKPGCGPTTSIPMPACCAA